MSSGSSAGAPSSVDRQVVLPFRKSVEISLKSLRVRFFRSLITTMSLVLAVLFFSYVRVGTDVANGALASDDPAMYRALIQAGFDVTPGTTSVGSSAKQRWIVFLSLLVCAVGIINAQLMAVTERFREIGTIKCLGALDSFVLRLFLLEAGMQGFVGATAGALLGGAFALGTGLVRFGAAVWKFIPWAAVGESFLLSIGVGCGLSLLGVLYPAIVAARMEPVEAMRAEH
ncbi:MAG: FtsX-like permease family protein [Deltaproteobacteria bacterium]|nr:FtsX-like permease family protein [Deltaproteobacteria bacterium]